MAAPKGNKHAVGNKGGGAPSKYNPQFAKQAAKAYQAGFTDQEVAEMLGVSEVTINNWKIKHVEFALAQKAKHQPDERVVASLYQRALGWRDHPPDVTACIFWLKNRRPDQWRDQQDHRHRFVRENRTAEEIFAELQEQAAELGITLIDNSAPPQIAGVAPPDSEEPE